MSARRLVLLALGTLALGLGAPAAALLPAAAARPELAVRSQPLHTFSGRVLRDAPPGQGFRCAGDGLWRIDVRGLAPPGAPAPLELVLKDGAPDGPELRRARASAAEIAGGWLRFELEPLAASAGRELYFELVPGAGAAEHALRPWVRYRAQVGAMRGFGEELVEAGTQTAVLRSEMPDLAALALAVARLDAEAELVLELYDETQGEAQGGEPVRRARCAGPVQEGFVFLPFESIAESYARTYRALLHVPPGAAAHARGGELVLYPYHGAHAVDPALLGMTLGGRRFGDRDLVFRAWTKSDARRTLALLERRLGARLPLALGLWTACVGLVLWLAARAAQRG